MQEGMHAPGSLRAQWLDRAGAEAAAVARLEFLPAPWREAFIFGLRGWLASMLALYLAFFLQLDQPYWAGMTVWMVIQPTPGAAISKGFYRVVGTMIGVVMGVVLVALFAQAPELFILALALWIGLTTVVSNLLTNFRGYAAVLAGYTAAIVALGAYGMQNKVFDIALARGAATIIGITCSGLVMSVFAPHRAEALALGSIRLAICKTARRLAFPLGKPLAERIALGRPLVATLIKLDTEIEFAAAEAPSFRLHGGLARSLVAHLFAALSAKRALEEHLERMGPVQDAETAALYRQGITLFEEISAAIEASRGGEVAERLHDYLCSLWRQKPESRGLGEAEEVSARFVLDRLADGALHLERAAANWVTIQGGWKRDPVLQLNFHRDRLAASINGLRAFLAVILGGAFWIESAWPSGSLMLTQFAVGCGLFSAAPHPETVALNFLKGVLVGVVAAYICTYYFLVNLTGFVPFALAQSLFLIPCAMLQLNPRTALIGLASCVFFIIVERPLNPMDYNPSSFLNNALATVVGTLLAVAAFRLFLPADPQLAKRYVIRRMRQGLQAMARSVPIPPYWEWQTRMFDRVHRIADPANPAAVTTDEWFQGGLGALHLGNEVLRLRHLIDEGVLPEDAVRMAHSVLQGFGKILTEPNSTRATIGTVRSELPGKPKPAPEKNLRAWRRFQGIIDEMDAFFLAHPRFLAVEKAPGKFSF